MEFCELVYAEVFNISSLLKKYCPDAINSILERDFESRVSTVPEGARIHSAQKSSIFSIGHENNKEDFAKALENYERFNATLRHVSKEVPRILEALQADPEASALIDSIRPK
jgi:hypothetical protein